MVKNKLYEPTVFWENAAKILNEYLNNNGIENFRSEKICSSFFVPTYGIPCNDFSEVLASDLFDLIKNHDFANKKSEMLIEKTISGYMAALADYRVFLAGDVMTKKPFLHTFSESKIGNPIEHFEFDCKFYSRSALNYILGLCFFKKHVDNFIPKIVLEIGGGFGTLGEIFNNSGIDDFKYINLDIFPMYKFSQEYLKLAIPNQNDVANNSDFDDINEINIENMNKINCLEASKIEKLVGEVDLFVNFISFQEMEPDVVQNYLEQVSRLKAKYILLRNLKEGKQKKSVLHNLGVNEPVKEGNYFEYLKNYILVETNIHPFGYNTIDNFNSQLMLFKRI